jgi:dihydrolipoamide dehydrogenase
MSTHIAIVGGGPAGYVAALHASDHGARVTLVGGGDLGGTCLWRGCIPTKSMVASARLLHQAGRAGHYGLAGMDAACVDWDALRTRAARISETNAKGIAALMANRGVRVIPGHGRLAGPGRVDTGEGPLDADAVILCSGSVPWVPAGFTVDGEVIGTSDDLLAWESLPASVLIVGGGVIACEFAFILNALGVTVTLLERLAEPLPAEEPEVRRTLLREMKKRGIRFRGGLDIEALERTDAGVACRAGGEVVERAERALIAIGRVPYTDGLGLDSAGIALGRRGEVLVDAHLRTNLAGVYAAGDVTAGLMLAHNASFQGRVAVNHVLGIEPSTTADQAIPRVTFTDPEVASIGLGEVAAREQYGEAVGAGSFDLRGLGMAHALGELSGFVKVIVDRAARRVLGIHIVGAHASEMINEASVILNGGVPLDRLVGVVHAHPTLSEAIAEAAEAAARGHATHQFSNRSKPAQGGVNAAG